MSEPFKKIEGKKEIHKWSEVKFDKEDYEIPQRGTIFVRNITYVMFEVLLYHICDWAKGDGTNYYTMNHFNFIKLFLFGDILMSLF